MPQQSISSPQSHQPPSNPSAPMDVQNHNQAGLQNPTAVADDLPRFNPFG